MDDVSVLQMPIKTLGFSRKFELQCDQMGFTTLEDILVLNPEELLKRSGFSFEWLGELSNFLNKHQLLHLLQPVPGRNFD